MIRIRSTLVLGLAAVSLFVSGCIGPFAPPPAPPPPCHILPADPYFVPFMQYYCKAKKMKEYWDGHNAKNDPNVKLQVASAQTPTVWIDYDATKHANMTIVGFHQQTEPGMSVGDGEGPQYWVGIVLDFDSDKS